MAEQPYNPVERTEQHSRTLEDWMACGHNPPFSVIRRLIDYTREVNDLVTALQVWCETPKRRRREVKLQREEVDSMLKELMKWHASLLKWLDNRQNNPNAIVARMLSDPNEKQWQADRRRRKSELEQQVRQGAYLANLKDTKTKRFHGMSAKEQRVLEEYDTGKMQKRHDNVRIRKPK